VHDLERMDGETRANQIVVLADAIELIEAEPATLGFGLNPSGKPDIDKSADAVQAIGRRPRRKKSCIVGLKSGSEAAGGHRSRLLVAEGTTCARPITAPAAAKKKNKARAVPRVDRFVIA